MRQTLLIATLILSSAIAQAQRTAESMLGAALHQEEVQGDLKEAIASYQKVLTMPGVSHKTSAEALLHLGRCYEKLGNPESRKAYEKVLREFPDQKDAVAIARVRLDTGKAARLAGSGVALRQVFVGSEVDLRASISKEGRYLSYADRISPEEALMLRDLSTGQNRRLARVEKGWHLGRSLCSPDGKQVAYETDDGVNVELRVVAMNGSADRAVYRKSPAANVMFAFPVGWSPDGQNLLATLGSADGSVRIVWISTGDGKERAIKTEHDIWSPVRVAISPDANYIAYEGKVPGSNKHAIFVVSSNSGKDSAVVESRWEDRVLTWLPDSTGLLFSSDRTGSVGVWLARVKDGAANGTPIMVKDNLGKSFGLRAPALLQAMGITANGSLFYAAGTTVSEMNYAELDPITGRVRGKPSPIGPSNDLLNVLPAWSPDGRLLAYHSILAAFEGERSPRLLHIYSPETHSQRDLNPAVEYLGHKVAWFPDSRSLLLWGMSSEGQHGLFKVNAMNGEAQFLIRQEAGPGFLSLSKNGKTAYYIESSQTSRLLSRDLETGAQTTIYELPDSTLGPLELSPDGLRLAFRATKDSSASFFVIPVSGGPPREVFRSSANNVTQTGYGLAWSSDGRYLYVSCRKDDVSLWSLWQITTEDSSLQDMGLPMLVDTISVRPDGRGIAFNALPTQRFQIWALENILP